MEDGVESTLTDVTTGEQHVVRSKYVVGCDGAGSRVRRSIGINLLGGPVPGAMMLVHFKSRDITRLHKQGQFWHIGFAHGAFIIAQDEVDTWTLHTPIQIDADWEKIDPEETVYKALGGPSGPWPIKIDEILVKSSWRPNICIAESYISPGGRVFLAGDSAHQNIPTGGYGMNTAVGDSFDLGWKLAAVLNGFGGEQLLKSYEPERLPVAVRNINHSGTLWQRWARIWGSCAEVGPDVLSQSKLGKAFKAELANCFLINDGENKDHGIEMGYRYKASPVVVGDPEASEPEWNFRHYVPSTWPGARPPHVFLADGETSIFDLFGEKYTIVDFSEDGKWADQFGKAAKRLGVPLKKVHLPAEKHVRDLWERDAVLIRPDDHVAWRSLRNHAKFEGDVEEILKTAVGLKGDLEAGVQNRERALDGVRQKGFAGTVGNVNQDKVAMKAGFQK